MCYGTNTAIVGEIIKHLWARDEGEAGMSEGEGYLGKSRNLGHRCCDETRKRLQHCSLVHFIKQMCQWNNNDQWTITSIHFLHKWWKLKGLIPVRSTVNVVLTMSTTVFGCLVVFEWILCERLYQLFHFLVVWRGVACTSSWVRAVCRIWQSMLCMQKKPS